MSCCCSPLAPSGGGGGGLPPVTADDNGNILGVVNGAWDQALNAFRVVGTLADRNSINAVHSAAIIQPGMLVYVQETQVVYQLQPDLLTWAPVGSSAGLVSQWFVDALSPAAPNFQDGLSPATAFSTTEALQQTICPNGNLWFPKQTTVIHIAPGNYKSLSLLYTLRGSQSVTLQGAWNTGPAITLSAVTATNPATNTRGQLTTLAGTFTARARIRVVNGAAAGSVTYAMNLVSPQQAFVKQFYRESDGSLAFPAVGDQVVVETPASTIDQLSVQSDVAGLNGETGGANFSIRGLGLCQLSIDAQFSATINVVDCDFRVGPVSGFQPALLAYNGPSLINCKITNTMPHIGGLTFWFGTLLAGTFRANNGGMSSWFAGNAVDGGIFQLSRGNYTLQIENDLELQNGTGLTPFALTKASTVVTSAQRLWGGAVPFTAKAQITSGAWFYISSVANCSFGSTSDFLITGHAAVAVAGTPIAYPRANCGVGLTNDPAAAPVTA